MDKESLQKPAYVGSKWICSSLNVTTRLESDLNKLVRNKLSCTYLGIPVRQCLFRNTPKRGQIPVAFQSQVVVRLAAVWTSRSGHSSLASLSIALHVTKPGWVENMFVSPVSTS